MTCGGEDSNEHVGRYDLGVSVGNSDDSGSRRARMFRNLGMGEASGLNDLGKRNGEIGVKLHFACITGRQPQRLTQFIDCYAPLPPF